MALVLVHFNNNKKIVLKTNLFSNMSTKVLLQYNNQGILHLVTFFFKKTYQLRKIIKSMISIKAGLRWGSRDYENQTKIWEYRYYNEDKRLEFWNYRGEQRLGQSFLIVL